MRIGIDVGGTNTDAVLMQGRQVLAEVKTPTTPDVTGMSNSLSASSRKYASGSPERSASRIRPTRSGSSGVAAEAS